MRNGEYTELKAFQVLAELNSFSAAAKQLRITPSALSQLIKRMETNIGTRLFNRTTRSVCLTLAGKDLYTRTRPAMSELESALEDTKMQSGKISGLVKIHCAGMAANSVLLPILSDFYQQYPDIVLDIVTEDIVADIIPDGYDVGITLGENIKQDMIAYPLGDELRMVVAATPTYLAKFGTPITPDDLASHQCINWKYMSEKIIYRWEFFQNERWRSVSVNGPLITTNIDLAIQAALQHIGIVLWTEDKLERYFSDGTLVPLLRKYCKNFPGWYLYYPQQHSNSGAIKTFIQFMHNAFPVKY
ncbi:LysR family transcriptional regulator [Vibrio salinus]|uniref:LysR family transcriptional regulator n=1 Tax=Vibrio salinus TaxID=2899784 RepID=UPI001E2D6384|nr:LysR family transcriptional regulator [Vibrio salinus]MCE0495605.1 LysR family transcriptional regulator [Vibrio salinus]